MVQKYLLTLVIDDNELDASQAKLNKYLEQTDEINFVHDEVIDSAEQKYHEILAKGTLSQDDIRAELKTLMLDTVKKDWEARKQELSEVEVPNSAKTLPKCCASRYF